MQPEDIHSKSHGDNNISVVGGLGAYWQSAPDAIDAHLIAARNAAGFDFTGTLARLCVVPPLVTAVRDVAPGPRPARETWFAEPAKAFDNLYLVGSKIHSSWAMTGSAGIILIDTLFFYNSEEEIVAATVPDTIAICFTAYRASAARMSRICSFIP